MSYIANNFKYQVGQLVRRSQLFYSYKDVGRVISCNEGRQPAPTNDYDIYWIARKYSSNLSEVALEPVLEPNDILKELL